MGVEYSPTEQALLEFLKAADDGLDVHQLTELHYQGRERPWNGETVVRNGISSLIRKMRANHETTTVLRIIQQGRKPALFRISRKNDNKRLKLLKK